MNPQRKDMILASFQNRAAHIEKLAQSNPMMSADIGETLNAELDYILHHVEMLDQIPIDYRDILDVSCGMG